MTTLTLRCQCHPPVSRELPAGADRDRWLGLLLLACRRRGCRCAHHEAIAEEALP